MQKSKMTIKKNVYRKKFHLNVVSSTQRAVHELYKLKLWKQLNTVDMKSE